ncbi:MAG TPA: hypothetical protein VHV55_06080 [Pirellulales bacterium]|jgi:hypothetical protein|nr:hypothetical protein [Pirellulales bacterium]
MGNALLLSLILVGATGAQPEAEATAPQPEGEVSCSQNSPCSHCGCCFRPKKVCRLKVGEGTYTGVDFDVKCEDYCIRGHSKCCGYRWIADPPCGYHGAYKVPIWKAACGALKTRRNLVRVPKTDKVTTYTCVVETVCCHCGHTEVDKAATAEAQAKNIKPVSFDEPIVLDAGELPPGIVASAEAEVSTKADADVAPQPVPTRRRLVE